MHMTALATTPTRLKPESDPPIAFHLDFLDGMRGIAALSVLLFHAHGLFHHSPLRYLLAWTNWGGYAVPAFIVISGFCLALPLPRNNMCLRNGVGVFWKKRIRRILPPYYAALILFTVLNGVTSSKDNISHLLLIHNLDPATFFGGANASFWSIAVECQLYVLFPALVIAWRKFNGLLVLAATILVSFTLNALLYRTSLWGICAHYVTLFSLGVFGCLVAFSDLKEYARLRTGLPWAGIAIVSVALLLLTHRLFGDALDDSPINIAATGPARSFANLFVACFVTSVLIICCQLRFRLVRSVLSWRPLVALGTISYSLYLLHQPMVNFYIRRISAPRHWGDTRSTLVFFAIVLPTIVGLSYLFHLLVERPFMSTPKNVKTAN